LAIGLTLVVGILVDMIFAHYLTDLVFRLSPILMLIIYLAGSIGCTMVIYRSPQPIVSFLGFLGLSVCMGLMLTYFISLYDLGTVQLAFTLTGGVFVVMVVLSTLFPTFFLSIGRGLGITLLVTIVVEVIATLVLRRALMITDYIIVLVFCGYVGFDWARAQRFPKTLDNAIDCAADIYVDIINLFIRILSILGRSKKN